MRPKRRSIMPSTTRCTSSSGVAMFCATPSISPSRVTSRKGFGGGPPLFVDEDVGVRRGREQRVLPGLGRDVGDDGDHGRAGAGADHARGLLQSLGVAAVDDDGAAPLRRAPARSRGPAPCSRRKRWPCGRRYPDPLSSPGKVRSCAGRQSTVFPPRHQSVVQIRHTPQASDNGWAREHERR
jgi:hypothetical protein